METLELTELGRRHGRRWALRGITLSVEEGEMVAVWGSPASGKTTLLSVLATLLHPSEGRARVDGHDLVRHASRVRAAVSLAFQSPAFDPRLSLFEALDLRAAMHGVARAHRPKRIIQLMQMLDIDACRDTRFGLLSDSQRRRAEVAAALTPEARVLLLDEPFVGMDTDLANRVWDYLFDLRGRDRVTLLLATSQPAMAERCHRIGVLHGGRIMACDTPDLIRSAGGKDVVIVQPLDDRLTARRLHERFQVRVSEEEHGFRLEVQRGDTVAAEVLGSFGGQTAAIYVRRPSLEAGLRRIMEGGVIPNEFDPPFFHPDLEDEEA